MTKMFPFITKTWNPLGGECQHSCSYCWAKQLTKRYGLQKYTGKPTLTEKELARVFQHEDFVFVCDMADLFGDWVPKEYIQRILDRMLTSQATYLLLTKNPKRYHEFNLPKNCVAGATIETDIDYDTGSAPCRLERIKFMQTLDHPRKMISIEPIMMLGWDFTDYIIEIHPEFVAVGYDNYHNNLVEPDLATTKEMMTEFKEAGIKVYEKTLREPFTTSNKTGEDTK